MEEKLQNRDKFIEREETSSVLAVNGRNHAVDLMKGLLIILMIIGHFPMREQAYDALYAFHMMAFVLLSGYFYKPEASQHLQKGIWKLAKAYLIPYGVFIVIYMAMFQVGWKLELKMALLAMSNVSKVLENKAALIGPIYFIPMLFLTRLLFLLLAKLFKKDYLLLILVFVLSVCGYFLGIKGYWLPWSFDISLYALIYYFIGYAAKKYQVMDIVKRRRIIWVILFLGWLFSARYGSMDIFVRKYNLYPVAIVGAVGGTVLFYFICYFLCDKLGRGLGVLEYAGKSTAYILIVHTQFEYYIGKYLSQHFVANSFLYCLIMIVVQLVVGMLMYFVMSNCLRFIENTASKLFRKGSNA